MEFHLTDHFYLYFFIDSGSSYSSNDGQVKEKSMLAVIYPTM